MTTPITSLQKEYIRLLDGNSIAMTIASANMASGAFVSMPWKNLTFVGCDFAGDGNIKLASMSDCKFIDCQFLAPHHDFGVMTDVSFTQCRSFGRSVVCGREGSTGVLFEDCSFEGSRSAPAAHEGTLADFLDLFHHRYLTHMYRAWAQGQSAAGLDRPEDEVFSGYIARLTGHDPLEIRNSVLPAHARLSASTHLAREARNPDGLAATLAHFFAVPVRLDEFVRHWIRIDPEDQSHLGLARTSSIMGVGAIAGEVVADRQNKFRLVIGPLSLEQYLRFTPQGQDLGLLVEWVRGFVGYEFVWEVELRVRNDSTPPARLEDAEKLGWSTWLGGSGGTDDGRHAVDASRSLPGYTVGMVFEPEQYICSRHHSSATAAR